jgi:hypothetical protein
MGEVHILEVEGRRYYTDDETFQLPSVTTILDTVSAGLEWWEAKQAAEWIADNIEEFLEMLSRDRKQAIAHAQGAAERYRNSRGDLGDVLHRVVEADLLGGSEPEGITKEYQSYVNQWRAFLAEHEVLPVMIEAGVVNYRVGYAGRVDLVAEIDGRMLILDTKTGRSVRGKVQYQLAAYRYGERTFDGSPLPECDGAGVLRIRPRSCRLIEVDAGPAEFFAFQQIRQVYSLLDHFNRRIC